MEEARNMDHNYVGTEHLFLGLLRETGGLGAQVLNEFGVKVDPARDVVKQLCAAR